MSLVFATQQSRGIAASSIVDCKELKHAQTDQINQLFQLLNVLV